MISEELSIGDLADAAGLSRRAVRYYVQQGLLQPPLGRGRGRHYDRSHLDRLRRIGGLQQAGFLVEGLREGRPRRELFLREETYQRRLRIPIPLLMAARKPG